MWVKKDDKKDFDVTMGSFDNGEICELVGLYILHVLGAKYGKNNHGIYRDDGLAYFENMNGSQADRIRKDFIAIFKNQFQLKIICNTNLKIVNFLDVTFDLTTGKYKPYNKPGNIPLHINVKSNHPLNIIKNLPDSISRRINKLSSDKNVFESSKDIYNALFNSGFKQKIKFDPNFDNNNSQNKNRKRNIIWFNPPYTNNVLTNLSQSFLTILDKHFPKSPRLHRIFNRNNVKISYSAMPNFASVINSHNKKIINDNIVKPTTQPCNCHTKTSCPLHGECLQSSLVYICKAMTSNNTDNHPHYIGLTENTFKDRSYKHRNSFKYDSKRNATELSNFVWENKRERNDTNLEWNVLGKASPYNPESKRRRLCLIEKYHIIFSKLNLLNSRNELVTKCRHENKYYLANFNDNIT